MKVRILLVAAAAAVILPAGAASAQSLQDLANVFVQAQTGGQYQNNGRYYDDRSYDNRRISQGQAIRIARNQGVRVREVSQRGNGFDIVGRDRDGARVTLRVNARTGQITRFDRQWDNRRDDRWDRDDRNHDRDRRDNRRDRDDDDDD